MRLEKHAAGTKSWEVSYRRLVENLKYHSEYVVVNGRIVLKLTLRKKYKGAGHIRLAPTLLVVSWKSFSWFGHYLDIWHTAARLDPFTSTVFLMNKAYNSQIAKCTQFSRVSLYSGARRSSVHAWPLLWPIDYVVIFKASYLCNVRTFLTTPINSERKRTLRRSLIYIKGV